MEGQSIRDASEVQNRPAGEDDHRFFMREALNMVVQVSTSNNRGSMFIGTGRKSSGVR